MKIIVPGGSGQVGTLLAGAFHRDGHEIVVLSRRPVKAAWRVMEWDGQTLGQCTTAIDRADDVINLAGRTVNRRALRLFTLTAMTRRTTKRMAF